MGIYVVTGGSKGIGEQTALLLKKAGHKVINVDMADGDICCDIGEDTGREKVVRTLFKMCPDGIDGLVSNAGIASNERLSKVLAVNYFGAIAIMKGLFPLLQKKRGRCVVTVSGSVAYLPDNRYRVDNLLVNCEDEERISALVDTFDPVEVDNTIYGSTKAALIHWIRRTAPAWALGGVNLNAVAPGGVKTTIMDNVKNMGASPEFLMGFPAPTTAKEGRPMYPEEIADALVFMVSPGARGMCGEILYCDTGTACVLHNDILY
ncbi:MAG: SDR family oxidoreductase [Oscillospiraceae bacterium]|nr:SDR family oxidoreductase [Oscillospiraceae bacterium]